MIKLPLVISLVELKHRVQTQLPKQLVKYEHCIFRSAHFTTGLISQGLSLNAVNIPLSETHTITVQCHLPILEEAFLTLALDPEISGTEATILVERPVRMRELAGPGDSVMTIPPDEVLLDGAMIFFQFEEDLTEWQVAIETKLKELANYDIRSRLSSRQATRPRAPV